MPLVVEEPRRSYVTSPVGTGREPFDRLCLRVVAMGDKNGVAAFVQECHEEMLRRNGCLQKEEILRYGVSFPFGTRHPECLCR